MRLRHAPSSFARYWPIVAVFVGMTVLQASVAAISIDLLSAVRAYVTGESLYSKGQKDAQIYLLDYAESFRERDYERFKNALAVPLGDRAAREALQKSPPDLAAARQGFLDGGNHPDDIDGLIRLFRWFHKLPFMSRAITTWTQGDEVIEQMRTLVDRAREQVVAGNTESARIKDMRRLAPILNHQLTELESRFSFQLGEASRTTQQLLLVLNASIALMLTFAGLGFVRHSAKVQAATEAEVIRRQESLQRLLDSAAEGLYGVDLQGRCTFINRAALTMLGYREEADLLGSDIHALIHHSRADGRPYPARESNVYHAYSARQASHSADEVFWRRDGGSFPVEYWSHPVLHDGELQGAVATFFDISERVKMQAELRRGAVRMERLVDAVNDGVITIDEEDKVVLFNRAAEAMFGTAAADAMGSTVDRFISNAPLAAGRLAARDPPSEGAVSASVGAVHELTGMRGDGGEFPLEASLSLLQTDEGMLITAVLRDVTALHLANAERRAREALEAANRAKTEFLSRMSHELRTPLNAVIGFAQLLRVDDHVPLSPQQLERIQHIEKAGGHLLALVNDILDLSRIDSGEMLVSKEAVSVPAIVEEATNMVSPLVTEAGIELFISSVPASDAALQATLFSHMVAAPPIDEVWVNADRVRLLQVLVNLLSNAVKYNRPGGSVALSWQVDSDRCRICIADTGFGIAEDRLEQLFEPFNRLGAEASKIEGTGIGLALSRWLTLMMQGELDISSTAGRGTVATLSFALAEKPSTSKMLLSPPSEHGPLESQLDVLYAEDNEVNAELVRQVVRLRPSVSLRVAENGGQALRMARQQIPDLMLIDMNLGDMTGLELARTLRDDVSTRDIRMIALSADALPEQIAAAMDLGFDDYLTKPIDYRRLLEVLGEQVATH